MASAEREPITGVWGRAPSGVQEPLVMGAKPPQAERKLNFNTITRLVLHQGKHFGVSQKIVW